MIRLLHQAGIEEVRVEGRMLRSSYAANLCDRRSLLGLSDAAKFGIDPIPSKSRARICDTDIHIFLFEISPSFKDDI